MLTPACWGQSLEVTRSQLPKAENLLTRSAEKPSKAAASGFNPGYNERAN